MHALRFAFRSLLKTPGFTIVAVLTLALGIGANTAIFSVVKSVLLQPLPYPQPNQLMVLWEDESNFPAASIAWPDLVDWQRDNTKFAAIGGYRRDDFTLTGSGEPEMLRGARVNASFFAAVGLPPNHGRAFTDEEDKPGAPALVVLGDALWQRRFGGETSVIGQTITLNGEPATVIGILPPEFSSPSRVDFLTQLGRSSTQAGWQSRGNHPGINALARMKPNVSYEQGLADLQRISKRIERDFPDSNTGVLAGGQPLFENAVGSFRTGLYLLLGAVGLVLLIACANLANLLLARSAARETEFSVRAALGASRAQLVRQSLLESLILAVAGGGLGLVLAAWSRASIIALSPAGVMRFQQVSIDLNVLAATLGLSLCTAMLFGLWPAWKSSRPDLRSALQSGGRGGTGGPAATRSREYLIIAEVALTLILLVGAGLLLKSFAQIQAVNLGFDPHGVLSVRLALPEKSYPTEEKRAVFNSQLLERIRALPGVKNADFATNSPLNSGWQTSFRPDEHPPWANGSAPLAEMNVVSDSYFRTLGIPLLRGRTFDAQDSATGARVVIIDQAFADRYWPGIDAIGQKLRINDTDKPAATIVGIVPTLKVYGYATEPKLVQAYLPATQSRMSSYMVLVRGMSREATNLTAALRRAVNEIDPNLAIWDARSLDDRIDSTFGTARLYTFLLAVFAALALLLAAVGLYGVLAYQVGRRTREIGIRMALGAVRGQVMNLILQRGLRLLAIGASVGLLGAVLLGRLLGTLLYRTSAFDPIVFVSVTLLLGAITLIACWLPARRATQVDPLIALRSE